MTYQFKANVSPECRGGGYLPSDLVEYIVYGHTAGGRRATVRVKAGSDVEACWKAVQVKRARAHGFVAEHAKTALFDLDDGRPAGRRLPAVPACTRCGSSISGQGTTGLCSSCAAKRGNRERYGWSEQLMREVG